MPYPETFYPDTHFGLLPKDHKQVQYRCQMVLDRLRAEKDAGEPNRRALKGIIEWDVYRCVCDDPDNGRHDAAKTRFERHWHSQAALDASQSGKLTEIVVEHAVPRNVVFAKLCDAFSAGGLENWENVRDLLQPLIAIALITKQEDKEQLAGNLKANMPQCWEEGNPFARYQDARIELLPPRGPGQLGAAGYAGGSPATGNAPDDDLANDVLAALPPGVARRHTRIMREVFGADANFTQAAAMSNYYRIGAALNRLLQQGRVRRQPGLRAPYERVRNADN